MDVNKFGRFEGRPDSTPLKKCLENWTFIFLEFLMYEPVSIKLREAFKIKMSQTVENVNNFLDPLDDLEFFEFGKKCLFVDIKNKT